MFVSFVLWLPELRYSYAKGMTDSKPGFAEMTCDAALNITVVGNSSVATPATT
jgi:hypothetical protein